MTPICFVCNHPILTYQSRLIWAGGNGWDDFLREQVEESTLKQRLGTGRRDSATQISSTSPPNTIEESSPTNRRRRRSSLAQLTDIFRERSAGKLRRRETMADIAKSKNTDGHLDRFSKRRESSVDGGTKSEMYSKSRRDSAISEIKNEFVKFWTKKEPQPPPTVISATPRRGSGESRNSRRGSGESTRHRRDSCVAGQIPSPGERQHNCRHHRRRQSQQSVDSGGVTPTKYYRNGHRPSVFSTDSTASTVVRDHLDSRQSFETSSSVEARTQSSDGKIMTPTGPMATSLTIDGKPMTNDLKVSSSTAMNSLSVDPKLTERSKNLSLDSATPPTIIMSSVTPPSISPTGSTLPLPGPSLSGRSSPVGTPTHPLFTSRRDSTTQCEYKGKEVSPSKFSRLTRQAAAIDESMLPAGRRGSQPTLLSDVDEGGRKARRDSLSPDSASYPRRQDSRSHLSPDRTVGKRDYSPSRHGKAQLRRQSTSIAGRPPRSPESSSCSSRDPSPGPHGPGHQLDSVQPVPIIRRQSTTDEIFIARGFRRQSTTEEMIRCRNFRRQSSQSDDTVQRYRGRRDSAAQIVNGTFDTMTVEMSNTFFDSSTQTEPSPLYDNNHYHEECLKCDSCHQDLTGPNQRRARRFKNRILCDLHFADVALMESSDFMQQLRSFKPQSLGCALARRKSSATLIFPLPPQACSGEFCKEFPHKLIATPGYWIECSRQQILSEDGTDLEQGEDDDFSPRNDSNYCSYDDSRVYNTDDLPRKKTSIEEQWEKKQEFELTSVDQETYEKYFHSKQHWNYFSNDDELGPVILSFKQELLSDRDHFRVLIRGTSYTVHGLIPASCVFADRYDREEIVRSLGKEVNINPPFTLGQLQGTPDELLKLDKVFIKSELKVGVIYVCEGQYTEEEILANNESSPLFEEFLGILGEKVRLQGFDKYKGGLDTVHDLTGLYSVYTKWRGIEIMFHVSTLLPYDQNDPQKLQRKRHIGNDIVCVVFLETDTTKFSPACIKSHFLHTFILVRVNPHVKRKVTRYSISVVTRDEVGAYKPYLWEQSVFEHGPMFREWLLTKIVNGERASYSAPKFATMQERTRTQMLEDIVRNLTNHAMTGKIPLPYRRGSWRPSDHTRPASPLLDSIREPYENVDQLAEDFTKAFLNTQKNIAVNGNLFDVSFLVSNEQKEKVRFIAVRAILATRSRVFKEILYGITEGPRSPQVDSEFPVRPAPTLLSPQKLQSSNYLQVPEADSPRPKSMPSSPMMKRAWSRLADWGRSIRKHGTLQNEDRKRWASSHDCSSHRLKEKEKAAQQIALPGLSVCANVYKVDRAKLAQTEFYIKEFDPETVRILLDYLHTGSCPLTCVNVPGLISAAEHYDLPDLLNACFHHAKQFLHIDVVCVMLCSLENYYWCYLSAHELLKMILDFIKSRADLLFEKPDFLTLSESMVEMIMTQEIDAEEIKKFEAMRNWAEHKAQKSEEKNREFKSIMRRLSKDLKLSMIPPQVLIKIVLPSRAIENQRILDALMYQANTGMYRNFDLEDYRKRVQTQESCDYGT